jgi:hypothetical protein
MTSLFTVPIDLLNVLTTPAQNPKAGFLSLYFKNNFLTTLSSAGTELDVVLDRPLTGFVAVTPADIVATDTVLEAFEKIQARLTSIISGGVGNPQTLQQVLQTGNTTSGEHIIVNEDDYIQFGGAAGEHYKFRKNSTNQRFEIYNASIPGVTQYIDGGNFYSLSLEAEDIKLNFGAGAGKILVSDASGYGSWQDLATSSITTGTGTPDRLARWITSSTLGDSLIRELLILW